MNPMTGDDLKQYHHFMDMVLAIHRVLLEDEQFKVKYGHYLNHYRALSSQLDGDSILRELMKKKPFDTTPDE
ncbi:MAG: hypothetical protein ABI813_03890 [Bacteroidota bacterium]